MKSIGRNDLCPCQSGIKYKICCGRKKGLSCPTGTTTENSLQYSIISNDSEWLKLRTAEGEVGFILDRFIDNELGLEIYENAWNEFESYGESPVDRDAYHTYFKYWLHYSWILDSDCIDEDDEMTIAQLCMIKHPEIFTRYQRRFIEAVTEAPFSFFIIQNIIQDKRLFLKDIMSPREVELKESAGTRGLNKGDMIFCRPITMDGQSIAVGFAPFAIPGHFFETVVSFRDAILEDCELSMFGPGELIDFDIEFRECYFSIMKMAFQPKRFSNTDGEPIVINEILYEFKCAPREIFDALLSLCPASHASPWEESQFDVDGKLVEATVSWLRINDLDSDSLCDNTSIGNFTITPTELKVLVNSNERAAKAMKEIQKRLGSKVTFKSQKAIPLTNEEQVNEAKKEFGPKQQERITRTPEMTELLKNYVANHWVKWLDSDIPALGGITPREATKTEAGREKLEALFLQFEGENEHIIEKNEEYQKVDVNFLRKELGLPKRLGGKS
jgi:hypothetical protein